MPFRSIAQKKYFYQNLPEKAKEWEDATPKGKKLPERVKPKVKRKAKKK